ncbi:type I-C CRISPR-associated protein Cas5c [[Mannheimia] succiniciproducens]|uniref:CRISPR pre-crRNA endoribonuclease Cas5d n=1 Tax=Mannheimia succiniciproducens (strain KCTC 0769BP / MBEL55E) TaxID=221988 RepID=CAS5D_MANSM|nr:type I-C CRISPR-associated protein Cas5c [[Mannheimia] succiniciproducens]Q65TW5.1 RecName: Full=CRISPR pre-crRNA endoribonuclease Cas5d; AltName: Full=Pre-crRNA processing endonuclease Cas5d [[Mannheimia] succiniciproducens MBEL55E]AAU37595.1 unknown [[Mannheimia] succiniciproducens MBEL55E]
MANRIRLHIWGDYACFTRPEMKVERVSYDVITPSAARGILSAIHWKPAINWVIDKIYVLKPIRFESVRRNELGAKISESKVSGAMKRKSVADLYTVIEDDRQQRAATVLKDVAYVIEAHAVMTSKAGVDENTTKHIEMFKRRALKGQCFQQPCMGVREFPAHFALIDDNDPLPLSQLSESEFNRDLGWMLHDIDFEHGNTPHFFRAELKNGVIDVPPFYAEEVKR